MFKIDLINELSIVLWVSIREEDTLVTSLVSNFLLFSVIILELINLFMG